MSRRNFVALLLAVCTALSGFAGVAQADNGSFTLQVVAAQLRNPRGMDFAANGTLFVAEAGAAGRRCVTVGEGEEQFTECFGATSAVTRVRDGRQSRVVTGLPSYGEEGGFASIGAHDVAVGSDGNLIVILGGGGDNAAQRQRVSAWGDTAKLFGKLIFANTSGAISVLRNMIDLETRRNPDGLPNEGDGVNGNPFSVLDEGSSRIVVDAGGNSLWRFRSGRRPQVLAAFEGPRVTNPFTGGKMRAHSVPTSVAKGPDGAYYVGELTGFPFEKGSARVWRVVPGQEPTIYARGFTNIIDVAFDASGNLLVLEMTKDGLLAAESGGSPVGRLVRVNWATKSQTVLASKGLITPTGLGVSPAGDIYISNNGLSPGDGTVVKLNK